MKHYIHQLDGYPKFAWDSAKILDILTNVAINQGTILGKMQQFGFGIQQEAMLNALTEEITKSSEIEGEILNSQQVRSSLARRLNIKLENPVPESHHIDGIVQAMMDAVNNYKMPLTDERLFGWHASLFPTGYSGMHKIKIAAYRTEEMQVVSSKNYRDLIHYEAPSPKKVSAQMKEFLSWLNANGNENPLLKAAIAHLWFVIIHPFDDGNGRLTRSITEMMLARAENTNLRFYSMSAQIQKEKKDYYGVLEETNTSTLDITIWLEWFFGCLQRAIESSNDIIGKVLEKAAFWQRHALDITNETQREIINKLMDGFTGNMTSGKVAKIFKISQDTAIRLLKDLSERGFLSVQAAGRSTHYVLINTQR
ncbi:MAG: Fic family protein [Endomicrobium sp.]|jgi:Fic family protein|nr:Fic family protein [Endomicrobium sp.]